MIESILAYSLRSALALSMLYIPYMLMLRKESFFRLNRIVLLSILLLSLALPLLDVHSLAWEGLAPVQTVFRPASAGSDVQVSAVLMPEVDVRAAQVIGSPALGAWHYVSLVFVAVMVAVFLWHVYQVVQMGVVMRRGSLWRQTSDGVHVYCHAEEVAPYSWMRSVVISERDYRENGREILLHEMAHVRARHSLDLLLLALVQTLQWWNPLVYILGSSMRDVHEYQADDSVLRHGVSARDYQMLLIKKVVGSSSYAFANNFDHSLIIKRITMMQKSKSAKWMCSKVLYILPMATLALSAFATVQPTASSANGNDATEASVGKVSTKTINKQAKEQKDAAFALPSAVKGDADSVKVSADYCAIVPVYPSFPGGDEELFAFLRKTIRYPAKAQELGIQGRVVVRFLVGKDGSISDVRILREVADAAKLHTVTVTARAKDGKTEEHDEAAYQEAVDACSEEVIRLVKAMPKWTPAYRDKEKTQPCATHFAIPVIFRLK